jgi:hypothetical protein
VQRRWEKPKKPRGAANREEIFLTEHAHWSGLEWRRTVRLAPLPVPAHAGHGCDCRSRLALFVRRNRGDRLGLQVSHAGESPR